jgi:hypothetical protein
MTVWACLREDRIDLGSYIGLQRLRRLYVTCTANYLKSLIPDEHANPDLVVLEAKLRDADRTSDEAKAKLEMLIRERSCRLFESGGADTVDYEVLRGRGDHDRDDALELWARLEAFGLIGLAYFVVHEDNGGKWPASESKAIAAWLAAISEEAYLPGEMLPEQKSKESKRMRALLKMFSTSSKIGQSVRLH